MVRNLWRGSLKWLEISYIASRYVTGPAKTGHVGTNYTPSLFRSYCSARIVFVHSVTCIMMPIKYQLGAENYNTIA